MAESTTIATLKRKRDEIARSILAYEKRLDRARADLAHINAAITIFAASGERQVLPPYVDTHRLFARGEAMTLCKAAPAGRNRKPGAEKAETE